MPHKQNPVLCQRIAVLALHARSLSTVIMESMLHEHERDVRSLWSEWLAVPQISIYTGTALYYMCNVLQHLRINHENMKRNLNLQKEMVLSEWLQFRLAPSMGRQEAQKRLKEIFQLHRKNGGMLDTILAADQEIGKILGREDYEMLNSPEKYVGRISEIIDTVMEQVTSSRKNEPEELYS